MTLPADRIESERRAFEAWMWMHVDNYHRPLNRYPGPETIGTPNGEYMKLRVQAMWESWLARAAVPVEITDRMIERGGNAMAEDAINNPSWTQYRFYKERAVRCLTAALSIPETVKESK